MAISDIPILSMVHRGRQGPDHDHARLIANAYDIGMNGPALPRLFQRIGVEMLAAVAVLFLVLMLAALLGNIIQHRLVWSLEALRPKLSKISPAAGLKRTFPSNHSLIWARA
jgi:flagellar biosynthesis protein FlhB